MKKSRIIMMTAVLGSVMMVGSVVAFAASGSGYQDYKNAVKGLANLENATITAQMELKDNNEIIASGKMTQMMSVNPISTYSNSSFVLNGTTHTSEMSMVGGTIISTTDGEYISYKVTEDDEINHDDFELDSNSSTVKLAELVVDTLVGDVKNQFLKDGNNISVNLEGAQIPELARLSISAVLENTKKMSEKNDINDELTNTFFNKIPQLNTIDVKSISMDASIENNMIKTNDYKAVIEGTDKYGKAHVIEITVNMQIGDVGGTVVKAVDTTGKQVKDVSFDIEKRSREISVEFED